MPDFERRLTTIMFTDIVGYSATMSRNEALALQWVDFYEKKSEQVADNQHGTIIKKMGDGMLMVFNSVKEALDAAIMLQQEALKYNASDPGGERLLVRIGIHVGDVLIKDRDIFGNGVNVAARLQQLAVPGGICLSDAAYSIAGSDAKKEFKEVRDVTLKNIAENYTVHQLPSIYPDEFPLEQKIVPVDDTEDFVITSMNKIPPEKLPLIDSIMLAFFAIVFFDVLIAATITFGDEITFKQALEEMFSSAWLIAHNIFFIAFFTFFILRDAIEIKFRDVRGADTLISYVIQQFGFRPPIRQNGQIIFKPTLYNRLMWQTQKMRVTINGNKMAISGSFIFLRKVKKMLKPYLKENE